LIFGTRSPSNRYLYAGFDVTSLSLLSDDGSSYKTIPYLIGEKFVRFSDDQVSDNIKLVREESIDGFSFVQKDFDFDIFGSIDSVAGSGNAYIAVGAEYASATLSNRRPLIIATTDGGKTWNKIIPSSAFGTTEIYSCEFGNGRFVAVWAFWLPAYHVLASSE